MEKHERHVKRIGTLLAELLALGTVIWLLATNRSDRLLLAAGTVLLVLLPAAMERLFHCRISLPVYIFALLYALGPMLGHCWYFYYLTNWWDKLLHFSGGVMFAVVGAWLFALLTREKGGYLAQAVFALCFSVAIAAVWEFVEFGADRLFAMDMQGDTLLSGFHSYLLGRELGVTGSLENIQTVTVNGAVLPGYIDVGLFDTMLDMLLESLGALITCGLLLPDKGKHPLICPEKRRVME